MRVYRLPIIVLAIMAVVAIYFLSNRSKGTLRKEYSEFAVSDTGSITKIFLADKNNMSVKVERVGSGAWRVNDKYEVNNTMIQVMLKTFTLIGVKAPVPRSARNNVIRNMAGRSVKIEIYQRVPRINLFGKAKFLFHEKCTRTYYVGDVTQNNLGTFMLMEGSEEPYIVSIPGFKGFVASRYSTKEADWRSHRIFCYRVPEIHRVSVQWNEHPEYSFQIENSNDRIFTLSGNRPIMHFDTLKVVNYLSKFHNLNFESLLDDMAKSKYDSLKASKPTYEIELVDKTGKTRWLKAWKRKAPEGQFDMEGNQNIWDAERMYGLVDFEENFLDIQYFMFGDVFVPIDTFLKTPSGK